MVVGATALVQMLRARPALTRGSRVAGAPAHVEPSWPRIGALRSQQRVLSAKEQKKGTREDVAVRGVLGEVRVGEGWARLEGLGPKKA